MSASLGLAVLGVIALSGLIAWLYRSGTIGARYKAARDELKKIGTIQKEGQRIDEETEEMVDRLVHDTDDGLRRFWLQDD